MKQRVMKIRIEFQTIFLHQIPPSSVKKREIKKFKKAQSRLKLPKNPSLPPSNKSFQFSPSYIPSPHKTKTTVIRMFLKDRIIKRRKKKNSLEIIMQSDRNRLLVGITYNRITLNKLAFNRLFSPDPLEFVRGSAALPSHTWNLRGWHTLSGGVPCSRCVFTFKSRKLCQGTAACINKSPSRSARYVSLSLG